MRGLALQHRAFGLILCAREVGEQMDLLALFEEELDDWVPLVVV